MSYDPTYEAPAKSRRRRKAEPVHTAELLNPATFIPGPLYSADAEKAVLASMMSRPDEIIDTVLEALRVEDFFVPAHKEIFTALAAMHNARTPIDITTLHQYLVDKKIAEAIGAPGYLAELAAGLATHLNCAAYIRIVYDKALLRNLQGVCAGIVQHIADRPDDAAGVLDAAETSVFAITNKGIGNSIVCVRDEVDRTLAVAATWQSRKGRLSGIPTGFYQLNQLTTGWQPGDMIVLAARPGVGKTALALTFARHALDARYDDTLDEWVRPGYGVGFFSLEMTNQQLMLRLLSSMSGVDMQRIRRGELTDKEMELLAQAGAALKQMPLYLDDSSFMTINQLRGKARRMKDRYGIDLVVVDYLQLLRSESGQAKDNRQVEVAEISRGIKGMAKELGVPVIILAQLNRKSEEGKAEPALHNLRESGAIEQDADMVLMLHRHELEEGATPQPGALPYSLIIAKQRSGPVDKLQIAYNSPFTRFEDPRTVPAR
ncbi:replicative DNA helicase [Verrucomicrobia bacterium LW23]|nr:replicative DNA helicase [Verrucomicrobia bacterium LW23]PTY04401.1 replicative DNA helicase [Verrucomicrobia bacterium LW23]